MKIRAENVVRHLTPEILESLQFLQKKRNFNAHDWVEAKAQAIYNYFKSAQLKAAVIGVSGGIDSALAAALIHKAMKMPNSSIEKLVLVNLPSQGDSGVTGQSEANQRALDLAENLEVPVYTVDMFGSLTEMRQNLEGAFSIALGDWAKGQGVAVMRTHVLYQITSMLSQEGYPALVIGTTNRDEGAYLGYVGKSGDGMVDLQVISDLHKSEVYKASHLLSLPRSIIDAIPTGDMFDACPDTDVFGAPYEAVELLILSRTVVSPLTWETLQKDWSQNSSAIWAKAQKNLEDLHSYNAHKYKVGSPAVHLDLMESQMPNGWHPYRAMPYGMPSTYSFRKAAPRALSEGERADWVNAHASIEQERFHPSAFVGRIPGLITPQGLSDLEKELKQGPWMNSDFYGQWREEIQNKNEVGSLRTTALDAEWANALWMNIKDKVPAYRVVTPNSRLFKDEEVGSVWKAVGINPLFRFMKYLPGSLLIPHYDGPVTLHSGLVKSGMTLVLYLDTQSHGGKLRFIQDGQENLPLVECNTEDWQVEPDNDQVFKEAMTEPGDAWLFDHFVVHDSSRLIQGEKTIVRTEIVFEKVS